MFVVLRALILVAVGVHCSVPAADERIVAVGDLHGDLANTLRVLRMAGILGPDTGASPEWAAAPGTTLVQTGDIVDRGPDTIALYSLFRNLSVQAELAGGRVVRLLGNHEVMNMGDDWRYVTREDVESFGSHEARRQAFGRDGDIGRDLRELDVIAKVGDSVFMHGGCTPQWARRGVDGINDLARRAIAEERWHDEVFGGQGVLWYRGYAQDGERRACVALKRALERLGAVRMVMGHTPQLSGRVLSRCDGRAIVIDVGISSYYGGHCAALEIVEGQAKAIYCDGGAGAPEEKTGRQIVAEASQKRRMKKAEEERKEEERKSQQNKEEL